MGPKFEKCCFYYCIFIVAIATSNTAGGDMEGKHAPRKIKQAADPPRSLQVEALSSKSKVSVTIDGTMVRDSLFTNYSSVGLVEGA